MKSSQSGPSAERTDFASIAQVRINCLSVREFIDSDLQKAAQQKPTAQRVCFVMTLIICVTFLL